MYTLLALALIRFNSSAYILATSCTNMQLDTQVWILLFKRNTEMKAPCAKLVVRKMLKVNFLISSPAFSCSPCPNGVREPKGEKSVKKFHLAFLHLELGFFDTDGRLQRISQLVPTSKHYSAGWDSQKVACCSHMPHALPGTAVVMGIMALGVIQAIQGFPR